MKQNVFIVDWERMVVWSFARFILRHCGQNVEILTASNNDDALKIANETDQIDFMIFDPSLPNLEKTKQLFELLSKKFPEVVVIFMSGHIREHAERMIRRYYPHEIRYFYEKGTEIENFVEVLDKAGLQLKR